MHSTLFKKGRRDTTIYTDGIYRRGGSHLMLQLTRDGEGFLAMYKVGFLLT
jgi:hypothetical protein